MQITIFERSTNNAVSISLLIIFFFSSRRRHTRFSRDWSSDVCSSDLIRRSTRRDSRWRSASSRTSVRYCFLSWNSTSWINCAKLPTRSALHTRSSPSIGHHQLVVAAQVNRPLGHLCGSPRLFKGRRHVHVCRACCERNDAGSVGTPVGQCVSGRRDGCLQREGLQNVDHRTDSVPPVT